MKQLTCAICDSSNIVDVIFRQGVYRCLRCGCLFRPEFRQLDYAWYSDVDYWYKGDEELKRYQKSLFAWFAGYFLRGNTIEFGAADGDFTVLLRGVVEPQCRVVFSELVDMLRTEYQGYGITKSIGTFEDVVVHQPRDFSNVCMIDVLEHLHDPVQALKDIYNMLVPGGRFFMATNNGDIPDIHDEMFRHQEHVVMLTKKAIDHLCGLTGFEVFRYFTSPQGLSFTILEKPGKG